MSCFGGFGGYGPNNVGGFGGYGPNNVGGFGGGCGRRRGTGGFALIVVLFILLIIVGVAFVK
ncbi:YjcZ family sporulation protein [Thalassobacillus sp. CUG 92003]|uniref:YjcZ family sporulation protein n=1 Tax=Thalassobacillus sp. CUG 92003 TaxID=2736641 RepID=UPI0015E754B1|nr:YjcZ family sporulation protein [Thalassobacillus sp. CUG 92003]